jgi:hypothetical protein
MNERVHLYLDGELSAEQLTAEERAHARRLEVAVGAVVGRVRSQEAPDLSETVLRRVRAHRRGVVLPLPTRKRSASWHRRLRWLWMPLTLQVHLRPIVLVALLAALVALPLVFRSALFPAGSLTEQAMAWPSVYVQFRLDAPGASEVALAGSFTGWEPRYALQETAPGVWSVLVPLAPGVHDYTFVVDGVRWIPDPHAPQVPDSFGGANNRITLLPLHEAV